jgi:hypothetical protein
MPRLAKGSFQVDLKPQDDAALQEAALGRMSIDKRFEGDLSGTSRGQMLSAMGSVQGSAGYVALERVTGTLAGRSGSFVFLHRGLMDRGTPTLEIEVVPDSGTAELTGLRGRFKLQIVEGKHLYEFDYELG